MSRSSKSSPLLARWDEQSSSDNCNDLFGKENQHVDGNSKSSLDAFLAFSDAKSSSDSDPLRAFGAKSTSNNDSHLFQSLGSDSGFSALVFGREKWNTNTSSPTSVSVDPFDFRSADNADDGKLTRPRLTQKSMLNRAGRKASRLTAMFENAEKGWTRHIVINGVNLGKVDPGEPIPGTDGLEKPEILQQALRSANEGMGRHVCLDTRGPSEIKSLRLACPFRSPDLAGAVALSEASEKGAAIRTIRKGCSWHQNLYLPAASARAVPPAWIKGKGGRPMPYAH